MKNGGNTILITGGSRGIGFEFAKQFILNQLSKPVDRMLANSARP